MCSLPGTVKEDSAVLGADAPSAHAGRLGPCAVGIKLRPMKILQRIQFLADCDWGSSWHVPSWHGWQQ